MKKELIKDIVINFYNYMEKIYGSKTIYKKDSLLMKSAGTMLDLFGILDKKKFMPKYATTILKNIYVPFVVGQANDKWDLKQQVSCCVHEHMHVEQYQKENLKFLFNYTFNSRKRAIYEIQAYSTNLEMYFYDTGKILDSTYIANKLSSYGCNKKDIEIAKSILDRKIRIIKFGGVLSRPSILAIDWLNDLN
jgi:hypothetical protein